MFSPDAKRLLIGSADGSARIWELAPAASWPPFQPVQGSHPPTTRQGKFLCIASSPDGRTTATATDDGMVHLTSAANEGPDRVIGPLASPVLAMAFSPDGALLLTGAAVSRAPGAPGEGRLWRTSTGQPVGPPLRHLAAVTCVAFSPDGKLALTGSDDQTARLWSVAVGCSIGRAMQHPGEVEQVAFDPDGRRLTTLCLARPTRRAELVADDPEDEETPPQLTRTWVIPNPAAEDAQVLVSRVESMTGLELGPGDVVQEAREP
jgi:WD40 repeat protein